jgi:calcineurin-like phosphoesterase family protein|tara:strand:+ start:5422 stop:5940 length:519 start_codon:yes stop_codon:yes gene_type:complete
MAQVRFIADLHFNHENCAFHRGFRNADEMNNHIIKQWNKVVHKRDVTYILGDVTMEKSKGYELLDRLNGLKHVVLGNHDRRQDVPKLLKYVASVGGAIKYKSQYMLTHIPIHLGELKYRFNINIHGHVHENTIMGYKWNYVTQEDEEIPHPSYRNVSVDNVNYTPKTLKELI